MKNQHLFSKFTNQYQVSKTLRFELKPQGKTLENIEKNELIQQDNQRAIDYKEVKELIDDYHRYFIEKVLNKISFKIEELEEFKDTYNAIKKDKNNADAKKKLNSLQSAFRNYIREQIEDEIIKEVNIYIPDKKLKVSNDKIIGYFFKSEMITYILPKWIEQNYDNDKKKEKEQLINDFKKWTTYFSGFQENRQNIYSEEEIPTSIIYRIVHDNLPKFLDNMQNYLKIKEKYPKLTFGNIEKELKEEMDKKSLDEFFLLENYNYCLNQSGIENFNKVVGGKFIEEGNKFKGINEYINDYAFKQYKDNGKPDKKLQKTIRALKMTDLFKQILSDTKSRSYVLEKFTDDKEVIEAIKYFTEKVVFAEFDKNISNQSLFEKIKLLLQDKLNEDNAHLENIYIKNDRSMTDISQFIFSDYYFITRALKYAAIAKFPAKDESNLSKAKQEEREKWVKNTKYFSITETEKAICNYEKSLSEEDIEYLIKNNKCNFLQYEHPICEYFSKLRMNIENSVIEVFENTEKMFEKCKSILDTEYKDDTKELMQKDNKDLPFIKSYLEAIKSIVHFIKPLHINLRKQKGKESDADILERDNGFYSDFDKCYQQLSEIISLYDKVRNYVTQKPFSTEKFKLNFDHKTLLKSFTEATETPKSNNATQNGAYLFRKINKRYNEYEYFLGVSKNPQLFRCSSKNQIVDSDKSEYERLEYYQALPKSIQGSSYEGSFKEDVKELEEKEVIKKLKKTLSIYENRLLGVTKILKENYNSLKKIQDDISEVCKNKLFDYFHISQQEFDNAINDTDRPLYMFRIANKDLNFCEEASKGKRDPRKRGQDNLHTMYFKALMREYGENKVFDIGSGELFYRKADSNFVKSKTVHEKGKPIVCKTFVEERDGKKIRVPIKDNVYKEFVELYKGKIKTNQLSKEAKEIKDKVETNFFDYSITKDKRYTNDKFSLHLSIITNYQEKSFPLGKYYFGGLNKFNTKVNKKLSKNVESVHILSIDRGERHLAYYTLLTPDGKIAKDTNGKYLQGTFNLIDNGKMIVDYHAKLDKVEGDRVEARKDWKKITNIKELKEGYLSQVVYQIVKMVVEYNAIIVFEDLNFGFKRGRFHIEKQVYQKLEKMLIDKLNYLVFKNNDKNKSGGLYTAYQLTPAFDSFSNMGKQTGIIFYVNANYTSKICPQTGFVNQLYPKYETKKEAKNFFNTFDCIRYNSQDENKNGKKGYFEFTFDYANFGNKSMTGKWTVCTYGKRIQNRRGDQNKWESVEVDITKKLEDLFREKDRNIFYENGDDIKNSIYQQNDAPFFEELIRLLKLTLQMRNSKINSKVDYMLSPVKDKDGKFFDSDFADESMPQNADANGAYHIGLKGMMCLQRNRIFRNAIVEMFEKKEIDIKWGKDEFLKNLKKLKDKKDSLQQLYNCYLSNIDEKSLELSDNFFKNDNKLNPFLNKERDFIEYLRNFNITDKEWLVFAQRNNIVKIQQEKLKNSKSI